MVVFLHYIRISPGSWTIQIGKTFQSDENGILGILVLVLAVSRRAAILPCLLSLLIAGACWPSNGQRRSARRLSSHNRNRGLGASSLDTVQRTLSTFTRYLLRIPPFRIAFHVVLHFVRSAIGDTPKPPRSSRAERRRDPIIFPPENASARQASSQFSLRIPQIQLGRFNVMMRQSNSAPADAAEDGAQAERSPVLPFFGPVLAPRRTTDGSQPDGGVEAEPRPRGEPPQSPSVQRPAFLTNCELDLCSIARAYIDVVQHPYYSISRHATPTWRHVRSADHFLAGSIPIAQPRANPASSSREVSDSLFNFGRVVWLICACGCSAMARLARPRRDFWCPLERF